MGQYDVQTFPHNSVSDPVKEYCHSLDVEIRLVSGLKAEEVASENVLGFFCDGKSPIGRIVEWDPKKPFDIDK